MALSAAVAGQARTDVRSCTTIGGAADVARIDSIAARGVLRTQPRMSQLLRLRRRTIRVPELAAMIDHDHTRRKDPDPTLGRQLSHPACTGQEPSVGYSAPCRGDRTALSYHRAGFVHVTGLSSSNFVTQFAEPDEAKARADSDRFEPLRYSTRLPWPE